ncbi:MAG TPA: hypothetical protein VF494_05520 [Candidatus Limnocylindrales bacterium]
MVAIQAYLVSNYQAELRREADRNRLLHDDTLSGEVRYAGRLPDGRPVSQRASASGADPRRVLARAAATVSRAAAGTARWLDPSVDDGARRRRASGAAGR